MRLCVEEGGGVTDLQSIHYRYKKKKIGHFNNKQQNQIKFLKNRTNWTNKSVK